MARCELLLIWTLVIGASADRIAGSASTGSSSSDFGFDSGRSASSSLVSSSAGWSDNDADDFSIPKITAWKNGIVPYEIAADISPSNVAALKRMFQDIADKTCVQFRARRPTDSNYVSVKSGTTCSAPLGMSTGSSGMSGSGSRPGSPSFVASSVMLAPSCFTTKRVGRRVMNLLGIPHETSRPDRDQFVEINLSNLRTGYANNVKQVARSAYLPGVLDVPYDMQSITQYNDGDLAKDPKTWAIRPKTRSSRVQTLGSDTFSSGDFDKIRKAYSCPASSRG